MVLNVSLAMAPEKTRHVLSRSALERLEQSSSLLSRDPLTEFTSARAREQLSRTDILLTGWGCPEIGGALLRVAPNLKLIAHAAGTVKYTIEPEIYDAGITVTHAAEANAVPVAEYTLAAIIFANKRAFELRDRYRADPSRRSTWALMDEPIGNYRRTVGLVGASRIGRRVARLLSALEVSVMLSDPFVAEDDPVRHDATIVSLDTLLETSDVVSLHAPALTSTRHMIGARELARIRDGATLINTARGILVDEAALLAELETGRISAIIDVTDPEIPEVDSPFFSLPNVFLTPHMAGAAGTERRRLGDMAVDEIERFVAGEALHYTIEPELLARLA